MKLEKIALGTRETQNLELKKETVRLLADLPTSEDVFGPHALLAEAIAEIVNTEEGGKAIALEGGWGSGKSSVIEMLKLSFNSVSDSEVAIHVFDAWSHEGDPLRRVFLEDLTSFCSARFDSNTVNRWAEQSRTRLTGRSRETSQTSTPTLRSSWPLLSLAFLTTFPIGVALLNGLARQDLQNNSIYVALLITIVVSGLVPASLLILFVYCQCWPFWPFTKWPLNRIPSFKNPASSKAKREKAGRWIALYAKKIDESTNTTAHESQGPTSIEFQQYFSELAHEFLGDGKRKLVLVLDNLDRVPPSTAKTLWTTLRVFAECFEKRSNASWAKRVWFIVPYDPAAARRLWDDGEELESSKEHDIKSSPIAPTLSAAFLDKTFQIRFDVPPLLLADWKAYLSDLLKFALGDAATDPQQIHRVYLLSRRMAEEKRRPPTPRYIKLYVNDIGALFRRFKGRFPLEHLALYAMLRRQGHDVRSWLLEKHEDRAKFTAIMGDSSFIDSLCAMAHGITDVEKAQDLHLRSPIEGALAKGDGHELLRLSNIPGFWSVLEIFCDSSANTFGQEEDRLLNTLKAIEESGILKSGQVECIALKRFTEKFLHDIQWGAHSQVTGEGIARALRMGVESDLVFKSARRLTSIVSQVVEDEFNTIDWVAGMVPIVDELNSVGLLNQFYGVAEVTATPDRVDLFAEISKLDEDIKIFVATMISLPSGSKEFVDTVTPKSSVVWAENFAQALSGFLLLENSKVELDTIVSALFSRLAVDEELATKEVERLVACLCQIERIERTSIDTEMKKFSKSGSLFRRLNNCSGNSDSTTFGNLMRWAILHHDFDKTPTQVSGATEGFALVKRVGQNPCDYPSVVSVFVSACVREPASSFFDALICEVNHLKPIIKETIAGIDTNRLLGACMSGQIYVNRFEEIIELFNSTESTTLEYINTKLLQDAQFTASLRDIEFDEDELEGIERLIRDGASRVSSEFAQNVERYLANRSIKDWVASLQEPDSIYNLLVATRLMDGIFVLNGNFVEAFEMFLNRILDRSINVSSPHPSWETVTEVISKSQQETIAARIIERADAPDKDLASVVPYFFNRLAKAASNHNEESFVRNVLIPIIRSKNEIGLDWLGTVASISLPCWVSAPEADRETFLEELNSAYQESATELRVKFKLVGEKMSVKLVDPAQTSDDE